MIVISPEETTLTDAGGEVARYRLSTRDGVPIADDVTVVQSRHPVEAAAALLVALPAPLAATADPALAETLRQAGATQSRHFHVLQCDLRAPGPMTDIDARFRLAPLPESPDPAQWTTVLPAWRAAFPPEHPDHFPGDDQAAVAFHLQLMDGSTMGPLHRASTLLIDESGTAVAGIMINVRSEESAWGGPWIADIWRDPGLRGARLGPMLISHAKALLRADGHEVLMLAVTVGNDARRSYEAQGFVVVLESWILDLPTDPTGAAGGVAAQ